MIVREFYRYNSENEKMFKTFSDKNVYIRKVGTEDIYAEAIDIDGANFIYEETDIEIEVYDENNVDAYIEA